MTQDKKEDDKLREEVALFRYGLIADLVNLPPGSRGIYEKLRGKAAGEHTIPGSTRRTLAPETLRDWLKKYRRGGFDTLYPRQRNDAGSSRSLPQWVADVLLVIKEEKRDLSVKLVIKEARAAGLIPSGMSVPHSTVHRLLSRHGLMEKPATEDSSKDRRRFAYANAGQLYMSDVMHGPAVFTDGRRTRKARCSRKCSDRSRRASSVAPGALPTPAIRSRLSTSSSADLPTPAPAASPLSRS